MNIKKLFEDEFLDGEQVFLKTSSKITMPLDKKTLLNRKGNILYNEGKIEDAKRIFLTTGYSDGLSRIGDYYTEKGRLVEALQMYWIAPDKKKADKLVVEFAIMIKGMIHEG